MSWKRKFLFRQYWKNSLWLIPVLCAFFGAGLGFAAVFIDKRWNEFGSLAYEEGTASSLLAALLGATVSFAGFVLTMLLLVPQFGGSQLTPRVVQLIYRDEKLKFTFGTFILTLVYTFVVMNHIRGDYIPGFALWLSGILVLVSILGFLAFISHFIQNLRPATAGTAVAGAGRLIIEEMYPLAYSGGPAQFQTALPSSPETEIHRLRHTKNGGYILSVDRSGLVEMAERIAGVIVFPLAVGDYLPIGDVLVEIHGVASLPEADEIEALIALGPERTFEQDPRFALRILVDIAIKALSPAINDPTTADQLIDRIDDLMSLLMQRDLFAGELRDSAGELRVVIPMHNWEEYLALAVTEIREYGYNSIQVIRRLRRMLQDLLDAAPEEYRVTIEAELIVLDQTAARGFPEPADLALAGVGESRREFRRAAPA